jgi:hypothetical protein
MSRRVDFALFASASGTPVVPGATVTPEAGGWFTASRGAHRLHLFVGGTAISGELVCAVVGRPAAVAAVVALALSNVGRGAASLGAAPNALRRRWAHWRVTGEYTLTTPDGATTAVPIARSVTLPTPLPGTALPWTFGPLRVDTVIGPALPSSIAGYEDADDAETGGPDQEP